MFGPAGPEHDNQTRSVVLDLVVQQDLILLLGKVMTAPCPFSTLGASDIFSSSLPEQLIPLFQEVPRSRILAAVSVQCSFVPQIIKRSVAAPWLQVLEGMKAAKRTLSCTSPGQNNDDYLHRIEMWRKFGTRMGLDEKSLRCSAADQIVEVSRVDSGCSWYKCALAGDSSAFELRVLLRCTECWKVCCRFR